MTMIKRLMYKEWYFQRWLIGSYLAGGFVALALLAGHGNGMFFAGVVVLLTVMIAAGAQIAITAGANERVEQTLPFLMTLPIAPRDYAIAKIGANMTMFLAPWFLLSAATIGMFAISPSAGGLIPFSAILLVEILASYCLVLGVAIVTESQGWAVAVMIVCNLFLQGFLYVVSHMPSIAAGMRGAVAVWNRSAIALLTTEVMLIVLIIAITYVLQSRKKDFI